MKFLEKVFIILVLSMLVFGASSADDTLSYEEKMESIAALRAYENNALLAKSQLSTKNQISSNQGAIDTTAAAGALAVKEESRIITDGVVQKRTIVEFVCDEKSEHNCELQEFMHNLESKQNDPYRQSFISNGKYEVRIFFNNDNHFPTKYLENASFENVPEAGRLDQENRIFEHYLGSDYSKYNPKLQNVYKNVVGISIQVASSDELNLFLDDGRIQGIFHIGNDSSDLEEGYH